MNSKPIDPAALAGATMACAVTSLLQRGPFGIMDMLVGIALLLIIIGYDDPTGRSAGQSRAVAAVTGFAGLVALGFPAELIANFVGVNLGDMEESAVPPIMLITMWLVISAFVYAVDRNRSRQVP